MTQKPSARQAVLDAFERLVIERGERAATLTAVAADARVSKGGLLYHFSSKIELVDGLVQRLAQLAADDRDELRKASDGVLRHFIRSAIVVGTPFDRTYIAMTRLAQSGLYPAANDSLIGVEAGWHTMIEEAVGDAAVTKLVLLVGDGLYYNAALIPTAQPNAVAPADLDGVIDALEQLARMRNAGGEL